MKKYICMTCGVQYVATAVPPSTCKICTDERQYVPLQGQLWTTLEELRQKQFYRNEILLEEEQLFSMTTHPHLAIGQSAYLLQHRELPFLWDCITYLDEETIDEVKALGGIQGIAISHPHYYATQVEWAETFQAPIYLHEDDQEWVTRPSERIHFWSGESLQLTNGLTLYRLGGHFKGGTVLHWQERGDETGVLLTGDIIHPVADHNWVTFMYSYPNYIPLPIAKVEAMAAQVKEIKFNHLYGAFKKNIKQHADEAVQRSAERYVKALKGELFQT
jgi:hypothetical protein